MTSFQMIEQIPLFRYSLIMADPPWQFHNWSAKGERKNPSAHYDCLPTGDFASWPIHQLAAPDCLLWLWATNPMLPQALQVMDAWGFRFVTAGHWVKRTKNDKLHFGTGYVLRSAGEPFLIGKIGNPKTSRSVRSVIEGKVREHSRKPEEAYEAAEALCPDAVRLDLFSRQTRPGWDAFGNEAGKFDQIEGEVA